MAFVSDYYDYDDETESLTGTSESSSTGDVRIGRADSRAIVDLKRKVIALRDELARSRDEHAAERATLRQQLQQEALSFKTTMAQQTDSLDEVKGQERGLRARVKKAHEDLDAARAKAQVEEARTEKRKGRRVAEHADTRAEALAMKVTDLKIQKRGLQDTCQRDDVALSAMRQRILAVEHQLVALQHLMDTDVEEAWSCVHRVASEREQGRNEYRNVLSQIEARSKTLPEAHERGLRGLRAARRDVDAVHITKGANEILGCAWDDARMTLLTVVPGSVGDLSGAAAFIGRRVISCNGVAVEDIGQLTALVRNQTQVSLGFAR